MEHQPSDGTRPYVTHFWSVTKKYPRSNLESKPGFARPRQCVFGVLVCIIIALHVLPKSIMAETETPDRPTGIRGSKKRKATAPRDPKREERLVVIGGDGDDDDEEKKIEEFFALVENYREARDRLACSRPATASAAGEADRSGADHHKRRRQVKDPVSAWDPCFQREDFMEGAVLMEKAMETLASGPPTSDRDGAENNGGGGLDLRLSL
ncbi:hypothetical protein NL676_002415 [Syzygium grande]|nr:hypothetical protein NL676_002415 [Syzygium grande]